MMDQPVTTNPLLISLINMTMVFVVLYGLSWIVRFIQLIDPYRKKQQTPAAESPLVSAAPEQDSTEDGETAMKEQDDMMVIFTAAIAAAGYPNAKITAIRPVNRTMWAKTARLEMVTARSKMFD